MASTTLRASATPLMASFSSRPSKPRTPRKNPAAPSTSSTSTKLSRSFSPLPRAPRCSAFVAAAALRNIDQPLALLYDCDGVLLGIFSSFFCSFSVSEKGDQLILTSVKKKKKKLHTESEAIGHRESFNAAFKEEEALKPDEHEWSEEEYGHWLKIGGGKERMHGYFLSVEKSKNPYKTIKDEAARKELLLRLHKRKTDLFMQAVESGAMPLRPGVKRLIEEAIANGVKVAVCSTSNERAVTSIVKNLLGPEIFAKMPVFAGDVVKKKKPAPDIYLLAAETLGVDPARCVVIEDSEIGLAAGRAAGMRVIVTKSRYTQDESFEGADAVFDCIGEAGEERFSLDDLTTPGALEEKSRRAAVVLSKEA